MAAPSAWTFTDAAHRSLVNGTFVFGTDSFKMALFLSTSNIAAGSTTYAALTNEVANANGYTTGGIALTMTTSAANPTVVTYSSNPVWTASGGSITARFAVIYEVAGNVVCWSILDSTPADVTATATNTLTVAPSGSGVFTV